MSEERDLAHEADMRALMRKQLCDDISPEEAAEECRLLDEKEGQEPLAEWDDWDTLNQEYELDHYYDEDEPDGPDQTSNPPGDQRGAIQP